MISLLGRDLQDVGDDSNRPAVNGFAVRFLGQYFRGCEEIQIIRNNMVLK